MELKAPAVRGQRSPRWAVWSRLLIPDRTHPEQVYLARLRIVQTPWFALLVHRIHTPDGDRDPHDHPWPFLSFVARGGYTEEVFSHMRGKRPARLRKRVRGRFSLHRMPMHAAHRITTVRPGTVTVILTGRRKHTWGFYTPQGFMTWQQYEAAELTPPVVES